MTQTVKSIREMAPLQGEAQARALNLGGAEAAALWIEVRSDVAGELRLRPRWSYHPSPGVDSFWYAEHGADMVRVSFAAGESRKVVDVRVPGGALSCQLVATATVACELALKFTTRMGTRR